MDAMKTMLPTPLATAEQIEKIKEIDRQMSEKLRAARSHGRAELEAAARKHKGKNTPSGRFSELILSGLDAAEALKALNRADRRAMLKAM